LNQKALSPLAPFMEESAWRRRPRRRLRIPDPLKGTMNPESSQDGEGGPQGGSHCLPSCHRCGSKWHGGNGDEPGDTPSPSSLTRAPEPVTASMGRYRRRAEDWCVSVAEGKRHHSSGHCCNHRATGYLRDSRGRGVEKEEGGGCPPSCPKVQPRNRDGMLVAQLHGWRGLRESPSPT
jgi:hypothetical protein